MDSSESSRDRALAAEELAAIARLWRGSRRELTARFGGSSMEPSLAPESEVVLRCGAPASVGDIVAYLADDRVVLHRLEAISPRDGALLTRGDALWLPDPPVRDSDAVLGVVIAVRQGDGLAPPPPPPQGAGRQAALWPFRAILALSPSATAALLTRLIWSRRVLFSAARALNSLLKAPAG